MARQLCYKYWYYGPSFFLFLLLANSKHIFAKVPEVQRTTKWNCIDTRRHHHLTQGYLEEKKLKIVNISRKESLASRWHLIFLIANVNWRQFYRVIFLANLSTCYKQVFGSKTASILTPIVLFWEWINFLKLAKLTK